MNKRWNALSFCLHPYCPFRGTIGRNHICLAQKHAFFSKCTEPCLKSFWTQQDFQSQVSIPYYIEIHTTSYIIIHPHISRNTSRIFWNKITHINSSITSFWFLPKFPSRSQPCFLFPPRQPNAFPEYVGAGHFGRCLALPVISGDRDSGDARNQRFMALGLVPRAWMVQGTDFSENGHHFLTGSGRCFFRTESWNIWKLPLGYG